MATTRIENLKKYNQKHFFFLKVSKFKSIFMEISRHVILCDFKYFSNVSYVIITWILKVTFVRSAFLCTTLN